MAALTISKESYLQKVRDLAVLSGEELHTCLANLTRYIGTAEEEARLAEIAEDFLVDVSKGYVGISLIVPLEGVYALLADDKFDISNWHYDRTAQCLLVNLRAGRHEALNAVLHRIYVGCNLPEGLAAEKAIDEGLAWFKSSSSYGRMLIGQDVRMTAQERAAFRSVKSFDD